MVNTHLTTTAKLGIKKPWPPIVEVAEEKIPLDIPFYSLVTTTTKK